MEYKEELLLLKAMGKVKDWSEMMMVDIDEKNRPRKKKQLKKWENSKGCTKMMGIFQGD